MTNSIVILNMNGDEEVEHINNKNQLAFVCGYTDDNDDNNFQKVHTWMIDIEEDNKQLLLHLYASSKGSHETINKYELPPPLDTTNYYGYIALVLEDENNTLFNLSIDDWKKYYEQLYGGFEDIEETDGDDDENDDDDDDYEDDDVVEKGEKYYTKQGYEIDDFVVSDTDEIEYEIHDDNEKN